MVITCENRWTEGKEKEKEKERGAGAEGSGGGKNGGQTKRGCVCTQPREEARVCFAGMFSNIGALNSSRVESSRVESSRGSLDKRAKGQLFGGGKDSWSNRPRRERRDAMGRSGYFPPTAHRLKIESPPSYGKDYLNLRSALTTRMPAHLSSLLPHRPGCQSRVPCNAITKGFDDDYARRSIYIYIYICTRSIQNIADIYVMLLCSRACVCTRSKGESNWTHLRTLKERCCDY